MALLDYKKARSLAHGACVDVGEERLILNHVEVDVSKRGAGSFRSFVAELWHAATTAGRQLVIQFVCGKRLLEIVQAHPEAYKPDVYDKSNWIVTAP